MLEANIMPKHKKSPIKQKNRAQPKKHQACSAAQSLWWTASCSQKVGTPGTVAAGSSMSSISRVHQTSKKALRSKRSKHDKKSDEVVRPLKVMISSRLRSVHHGQRAGATRLGSSIQPPFLRVRHVTYWDMSCDEAYWDSDSMENGCAIGIWYISPGTQAQ